MFANNIEIYENKVAAELLIWQKKMQKSPSVANSISKAIQKKVNALIPDKVHEYITTAIKQMVKLVLYGSTYTATKPLEDGSLMLREAYVREKIDFYKKAASAEGAIVGAGGILMGLAEFPILFGIKIKLLYDIAALYGHDVTDYRERVFILYVFQLAFSSQERRNEIYQILQTWPQYVQTLPNDINEFDWLTFQQEYRDYLDLAKLAQLIPIIGAPVGAIVNYQLLDKLGDTAKNSYRLRRKLALGDKSI